MIILLPMLFAQNKQKTLEEMILESLHTQSQSGPALLGGIKQKNPFTSKETFYRILRSLLNEEVIHKHGNIYEINRHWLQQMYRFSKKHIKQDVDHILSFKEGDRITYKFKNPNLMGIYWAHTYDTIFEKHDPNVPILVFHPHEWLIHTRKQSELFFLNRFQEDKKLVCFSIGGTTELDKKFNKEWSSEFRKISTGVQYGLKNTEYINVLGDFIFKVTVGKKFSEDVDVFFKKYNEITLENLEELENLCNRNDRARMIFTRSKKEADRWRTKFKKHFFIPKKYQPTFDKKI